MTTCEKCGGVGFVIVEHNGLSGARICSCRAAAVERAIAEKQPIGPPPREDVTAFMVKGLCQLLAFSPDEAGMAIIVNALIDMCYTEEQVSFVINRAANLYTKWEDCGILGLRQILCSRYTSRDGLMVYETKAYPDGVPSFRPPEPWRPMLAPGKVASEDPLLDRQIEQLGRMKAPGGPEWPSADDERRALEAKALEARRRAIVVAIAQAEAVLVDPNATPERKEIAREEIHLYRGELQGRKEA